MQVVSFTRRQDRAAHSRSVRVRHQKAKPLAGANRAEGFHQSTQPECSNDASLATQEANEARIKELSAAMNAAAVAGDLATFKTLNAEWEAARALRSHAVLDRLNAEKLAEFERIQTLSQHGYWLIPKSAAPTQHQTGIKFVEEIKIPGLASGEAKSRRSA